VRNLGTGIELELEPRTPEQLRQDVEVVHEYDLAYYHWDYSDADYWLWPLFDPSDRAMGRGGRNFLGYHNDPELEPLFRQVNGHREFEVIKKLTHDIHAIFHEKMPFIPLWQLDTHVAYHEDLTMVHMDPLLIFPHIEEWKLNRR
jgi:peptide/nickel transport system substrate-binding protein